MYHDILLTQYTKVHSLQATENHNIPYMIYGISGTVYDIILLFYR